MSKYELTGIAVSDGYGIGHAYKLAEPDLTFETYIVSNIEEEIARLHVAIGRTEKDLQQIQRQILFAQGEEAAKIFFAHMLVLDDPEMITDVEKRIKQDQVNAEWAWDTETSRFIALFEQMKDEYLKERVVDLKDIKRRVLSHLLERPLPDLSLLQQPAVIVTEELAPSDIAQMNREHVKALVTDKGSKNSHATIMARMLGVPSVISTKEATAVIVPGDELLVDAVRGTVMLRPDKESRQVFYQALARYEKELSDSSKFLGRPTVTKDGRHVTISANIGSNRQMDTVRESGAEGIGLYRTEFLYMEKQYFPSEEEQLEAYRNMLEAMENKQVVIRTIDIGGDKNLDYWQLPADMNPSLGERAIRLSLNNEEVFRTQLRAMLRASKYGNLSIMFPMIATMEEWHKAQQILAEEKKKLQQEHIFISKNISVGIMVETPATALLAAQFAKEVDFFSIGTNDLIQYTFAADRMNEAVAYLYQPYHPVILKIIGHVIQAAHQEGKKVSMCGEMAADRIAVPLLLGLGLDDFSMSPSAILQVRSQISRLKQNDMEKLAEKAKHLTTSEEVQKLVTSSVGI